MFTRSEWSLFDNPWDLYSWWDSRICLILSSADLSTSYPPTAQVAQSWFFGRYEPAVTSRRLREAADWRQLRRWSRARIFDSTKDPEAEFAGMGILFRFGYKDWFDFSFRIGPRKSVQKTVTKEVFLQSKYHVRCHGPKGRLIEMKNDTVSLIASSFDKSITSIRCLPQPTWKHWASLH